jgi:hypothetical protein
MQREEYDRLYARSDTGPGWKAIDDALVRPYGAQEPVHYVASTPAALGGADYLNGISVYASSSGDIQHLHYVTYGFSSLFYDAADFGKEISGFGFELTFRLAAAASEKKKHAWVPTIMQNLARYVYKSGNGFEEYHFINAKGAFEHWGETAISAFAIATDPELGAIDSPHGIVRFLQLVGITGAEFDALIADEGEGVEALLDRLRVGNPLLVTDLRRK